MSKPRYKWWGYVKNVIRAYPDLTAQAKAMKEQQITASYQATGGSSEPGKPVERLALKELPPQEQRELEAVEQTIRTTKNWLPEGKRRLMLIDMVFWKKSHTLCGAADALYISYATAKRWHNAFICLTAENLGLKS